MQGCPRARGSPVSGSPTGSGGRGPDGTAAAAAAASEESRAAGGGTEGAWWARRALAWGARGAGQFKGPAAGGPAPAPLAPPRVRPRRPGSPAGAFRRRERNVWGAAASGEARGAGPGRSPRTLRFPCQPPGSRGRTAYGVAGLQVPPLRALAPHSAFLSFAKVTQALLWAPVFQRGFANSSIVYRNAFIPLQTAINVWPCTAGNRNSSMHLPPQSPGGPRGLPAPPTVAGAVLPSWPLLSCHCWGWKLPPGTLSPYLETNAP